MSVMFKKNPAHTLTKFFAGSLLGFSQVHSSFKLDRTSILDPHMRTCREFLQG